MKKKQIIFFVAVVLCALNAQAKEQKEIFRQETTVVTASRYQQNKDEVIPSVTVITRDDIENLQADDITEILSLQKGIDVARSGGPGSTTSIFMRGTNSNHSLVLINGVRAGSAASGSFAWEHLPVSQIERVEIVRGTRVSYYGADAIGGVINIITRNQSGTSASISTGSYGTENYNLAYGSTNDKMEYSLSFGYQNTDGFSATNENNSFAFNPDDDGYENTSISLNSSFNLNTGKLNLTYYDVYAGIDFDSFYDTGHSKNRERVSGLSWQGHVFNNWESEITIGNNKNSIKTKAFSDEYHSDRTSFDALLNKELNQQHYALGFTWRKEKASYRQNLAESLSYRETRINKAVFINWQGNFDNDTLSLSGRYDHNNIYGSNSSAGLDWSHSFSDNAHMNLSAGTAFHAPDFNSLFSPSGQAVVFSPELNDYVFLFSIEGNPNLKPEKAMNYQLGLFGQLTKTQSLSFNSFYYKVDNLIEYIAPTYKPVNISKATIKGIEIDYHINIKTLDINVNATVQDARNNATSTKLLRRPDEKMNLNLDKSFNKFSVGSSLRYSSAREDFDSYLSAYTVWDLRGSYNFNDNWTLSLKLENVTDQNYQLVNGYNTPGASGYITLQWLQ